jgi:LacI family transcriptional regulator
MLVEHLIGLGHRRIGLVAGQPGFETTNERVLGYRQALSRHGIAIAEDLMFPGNASVAAATASTKKLLSVPGRVTAIATGNNLATIGAVRALSDAQLRVPDDIALACFDDFEWADFFEPRLTVVAQPCEDIGRRAAQLLSQRIKSPDAPVEAVRLKPKLIIRRSCGSSPAAQSARTSGRMS